MLLKKKFMLSRNSLAFLLYLVVIPLSSLAQDSLTFANKMRDGDKIIRQRVSGIQSGRSGVNVLWDFRDTQIMDEEELLYEGDSLVLCVGNKSIQKYLVNDNGIWQIGWETNLELMEYQAPVCLIIFPMTYGESLSNIFYGKGKYCDLYDIDVCGTHETEIDACGTMIIGENDTLQQVIRLHSIRTQSMAMDALPSQLDSALTKRQQIEERYVWYARGYRYPVMEMVSRASYYQLSLISTYQETYQFLPHVQRLAYTDSLNEAIALRDSMSANPSQHGIIHYMVSLSGSELVIDYDLESQAQVTFLLSDVRGILYRKKVFTEEEGIGYQTRIDCFGLHTGDYILYMNINGQIYSEKIRL